MEIRLKSARRYVDEIPTRLRVVGVWGGELTEGGQRLAAKEQITRMMDELKFRGDFGETLLFPLPTPQEAEPEFVMLFGLGSKNVG